MGDSRSSSALGGSPRTPSPATAGGHQSPKGAGRAIPPVQPRAATSSHRGEQIRGGRSWGAVEGGCGCQQGSGWEPPGAGQPSVPSTVGRHGAAHGIEPHRAARSHTHSSTYEHPYTLTHRRRHTIHTAEQASWSRVLSGAPAHRQLTALPSPRLLGRQGWAVSQREAMPSRSRLAPPACLAAVAEGRTPA